MTERTKPMDSVMLSWNLRNWLTISLMALVLWFGLGFVMSFFGDAGKVSSDAAGPMEDEAMVE